MNTINPNPLADALYKAMHLGLYADRVSAALAKAQKDQNTELVGILHITDLFCQMCKDEIVRDSNTCRADTGVPDVVLADVVKAIIEQNVERGESVRYYG